MRRNPSPFRSPHTLRYYCFTSLDVHPRTATPRGGRGGNVRSGQEGETRNQGTSGPLDRVAGPVLLVSS